MLKFVAHVSVVVSQELRIDCMGSSATRLRTYIVHGPFPLNQRICAESADLYISAESADLR